MEKHSSERTAVPLTALRDGETGIVTSIRCGPRHGHGFKHGHALGWGFEKRLMDMGLTPGTRVTVVKLCPFHGPVEVAVRGSRLALGRGMAERIFVEREKE